MNWIGRALMALRPFFEFRIVAAMARAGRPCDFMQIGRYLLQKARTSEKYAIFLKYLPFAC
jgi:hypothetical protein